MTYATTFSGIGGWEIGLDACGWGLSWQCEKEAKLLAFLAQRFGVPVFGDIRTLANSDPEKVDVLIGSPPCQPFSTAGKRGGTGDERHLYPSFLDTVRHLEPRWVLMEQVPAILSPERTAGRLTGPAPIGAYIGGLAALGYLGCYHCIPACAVGAPHRRDRIWIIAHTASIPKRGLPLGTKKKNSRFEQPCKNVFNSTGPRLPDWAGGTAGQPKAITEFERPNGREIERDFCGMAHVVSHRVDRLKGLGNAVVPIIPKIIGQAINQVEEV